MNIYQKLIEVRKAVPYLKKDNKGYQFQYVSSSQTLGALRAKMDEIGLLLIPRVESKEVGERTTSKGGKEVFTELTMSFTWVNADNPEETIECPWYGQGLDSGEKGVGKAMTYAEKYFMLKFFNIATDKDDPDAFQEKNSMPAQPEPPKQPKKTKNFKFLKAMGEQKKRLGDEEYYKVLGKHGYEHADEIVERKKQVEIYEELVYLEAPKTEEPEGMPEG